MQRYPTYAGRYRILELKQFSKNFESIPANDLFRVRRKWRVGFEDEGELKSRYRWIDDRAPNGRYHTTLFVPR